MTTPKIVKSQTLDFGPAMPLQLSKKPTENEPHVAKMRWFNIGSWTAVALHYNLWDLGPLIKPRERIVCVGSCGDRRV